MNPNTATADYKALSDALYVVLLVLRALDKRINTTRPLTDDALLIAVGAEAQTRKIQAIKALRGVNGVATTLVQAKGVIDLAVEAYEASLRPNRDFVAEALRAAHKVREHRPYWDEPSEY